VYKYTTNQIVVNNNLICFG